MSSVERIIVSKISLAGVRQLNADDWDGKILDMSRQVFGLHSGKGDLNLVGVYVIFADHFDKSKLGASLYVGQGDDVRQRLLSHLTKETWNRVLIFTSTRMDVAIAFNVEREFIAAAKLANRYKVSNRDRGQSKKVEQSVDLYVKEFVEISQNVLRLASVDVFSLNEDGKYFLKDQHCDAAVQLEQSSPRTVTVIKNSFLWNFYIEESERNRLTAQGFIKAIESQVRFVRNVKVDVTNSTVPCILGEQLMLSKFKSNCGMRADEALRLLAARAN